MRTIRSVLTDLGFDVTGCETMDAVAEKCSILISFSAQDVKCCKIHVPTLFLCANRNDVAAFVAYPRGEEFIVHWRGEELKGEADRIYLVGQIQEIPY